MGQELWDWFETSGTATRDKQPTVQKPEGKSPAIVKGNNPTTTNCGEKYCIKKGDKSELIREINIRLAGFGGNVPTDEFTDRTEKMVKQFQRDYMKVPETGKVCGDVLKAIDDFQNKFNFNFESLKCKCGTCTGFGDNSNKERYLKGNTEAYHKYEYPGIHRLLLWSLRAVIFYLKVDGRYSLKVAPIILKHEGGYKNQPSKDKGDPTNKGISWPIWVKYAKEDLGVEPTASNQKELTDEQATIIYRKRYWEPKGFCKIVDDKVSLMIYDWTITSGGAAREVQKLLVNEFGQTLTIDGGMGTKTAEAVNNVSDQNKLLNRIAEIRREYYKKGAEEGWFSADYSKGLDNRVTKCLNYEI